MHEPGDDFSVENHDPRAFVIVASVKPQNNIKGKDKVDEKENVQGIVADTKIKSKKKRNNEER